MVASRTQLPLKLAWAITIHKSQGMTISSLELSLADAFEAGQIYVALSRGVSLEGITVLSYDPAKIWVHRKVAEFGAKLKEMTAAPVASAAAPAAGTAGAPVTSSMAPQPPTPTAPSQPRPVTAPVDPAGPVSRLPQSDTYTYTCGCGVTFATSTDTGDHRNRCKHFGLANPTSDPSTDRHTLPRNRLESALGHAAAPPAPRAAPAAPAPRRAPLTEAQLQRIREKRGEALQKRNAKAQAQAQSQSQNSAF